METYLSEYTIEIEFEAEIEKGRPPVTEGAPENCEPGEDPQITISKVWILSEEGMRSQQLIEVPPCIHDALAISVIEQSDPCDLWE